MPQYHYKCKACEHRWSEWAKISDPRPEKCLECGKEAPERVPSRSGMHLKGSGWFRDGYSG